MKKKFKIAVTGGIGSGKSYVCDILEEKGYKVIRADALGKKLLETDADVKKEVSNLLGVKSYSDNLPDKKYIGDKVFNNPDLLDKLNSIIHPRTIKIIEEEMESVLKSDSLVFVESALIYEADREENFDYVILVAANESLRIKRIVERDGVSEEEVQKRIDNQIPENKKKKWADFVINNDGSKDELACKIDFILLVIGSIK